MFHRRFVVKVSQGLVEFSAMTTENRVDVHIFRVEAFKDILSNAKEEGRDVRISIPVTSTHKTVYSVHKAEYAVMAAEFDAQTSEGK